MSWLIVDKNERPHFIGCGQAKLAEHVHLWRTLDEYEFFLVQKGSLSLSQDGVGEITLGAGDFWISRPNLSYGGAKPSTASFEWMHFRVAGRIAEKLPTELGEGELAIPMRGHIEEIDGFLVNFAQLQHYAFLPDRRHLCDHLVAVLIQELPYLVEDAGKRFSSANRRFQDVIEYMWSSPTLQEVTSTKSMAEFFGYNEKYFIRLFTKNMGETPMQYFLSRKITRAKRYLARSDLSVREIADMLGYDYYYFMRMFKKRTGMTPMQYRAAVIPDWSKYRTDEERSLMEDETQYERRPGKRK